MTAIEFCYWLQGYFELGGGKDGLTDEQVQVIKNHLSLAFKHDIDPKAGPPKYQNELNQIHNQGLDYGPNMRC